MSGFGPKHDIPGDLGHVVFVLETDLPLLAGLSDKYFLRFS